MKEGDTMYGQVKNLPEQLRKKIEALYGISYLEWIKLRSIIDQSFEIKRGEADKRLHLSCEEDIFNPF